MASRDDSFERFLAEDRAAWRAWLAEHHAASPGVWLVTYKKASGKPALPYGEAVEEALCFGWIDSRPKKLDDERTMLLYTPRKPKSVWSGPNKERVARLVESGLMTPVGLARIEAAKADGSWDALNELGSFTVPPDLAAALAADETARSTFDGFTESQRQQLLLWINDAKRPETRAKRVARLVAEAAEGRNPLNWHQQRRVGR